MQHFGILPMKAPLVQTASQQDPQLLCTSAPPNDFKALTVLHSTPPHTHTHTHNPPGSDYEIQTAICRCLKQPTEAEFPATLPVCWSQ
jgi:hypothetical protein